MYIESPHDSKPIPQPSRPCLSQATCVNPIENYPNSTKFQQRFTTPAALETPRGGSRLQARRCPGGAGGKLRLLLRNQM